YREGFSNLQPVTAGSTHATAIQIGNPVSFGKAVKALRATDGIVEQATESELVNASAEVDRFGFFNDPQTGVALASTIKLVKSRREQRSEEHTSELQSPYDLVCRLLLEKKNDDDACRTVAEFFSSNHNVHQTVVR